MLTPDGGAGCGPAWLEARPTPTADELIERLGLTDQRSRSSRSSSPARRSRSHAPVHDAFDGDLPVILVSARQTDAFDRTAGLMLGADDYVSKPLDAGELMARVSGRCVARPPT